MKCLKYLVGIALLHLFWPSWPMARESQDKEYSYYVSVGSFLVTDDESSPKNYYITLADFSSNKWGAVLKYEKSEHEHIADRDDISGAFTLQNLRFIISRKITPNFYLDISLFDLARIRGTISAQDEKHSFKFDGQSYGLALRYKIFVGRTFFEITSSYKRYSGSINTGSDPDPKFKFSSLNHGIGIGFSF